MTLLSTYRVQLHKGFTLHDASAIVSYLAELGITHLYCSPVLAARPGSTHGYDVIDPTSVNGDLDGEHALAALAEALHGHGMGLVLDIVPNHMGIGGAHPEWNRAWEEVLTHGDRSRFARWFDIDWGASRNAHGRGQVVLPVLAAPIDDVLARGELQLDVSEENVRLRYHEQSFPVDLDTLPPEVQLAKFDPTAVADAEALLIEEGGRAGFRELIDAQHYRLTHWRAAPEELNYRRFFDINDLVALRQEDPQVFLETHGLILKLVELGIVDGLRVDHVDGLRDPLGYLTMLRTEVEKRRSKADAPFPIFVEKILAPGEQLRPDWPVQGTTGYEFLNDLEDLFISPKGFVVIDEAYRRMRRFGRERFADVARDAKVAILNGSLHPDVVRLARRLAPIAIASGKRWGEAKLTDGIVQYLAALPVYRTYVDGRSESPNPDDVAVVERAVAELRRRGPAALEIALFVADVVLGRAGRQSRDDARWLDFVQRLQQTSGPAIAKGVEDTALYVYVPLTSRNEVGGAPDRPLDDAVERLHEANTCRASRWPRALLCTNTHDTKRSADLRARLDVLSEIPREWDRYLLRWRRLNRRHRSVVAGRLAPDTNSEYLFYQTLIGLWPTPRPGRRVDDLPDRDWLASARDRLVQYMLKAAREAKLRTSWTEQNAEFEQALERFVRAALEPTDEAPFLQDVARLVARIAHAAHWNALSRLLIHLTSPGTPDLYRGDELWCTALVDPDNRRPLDWDRRRELLASFKGSESLNSDTIKTLARDPANDRLKLFLTMRLLHTRRENAALFRDGDYQPITLTGDRDGHLVAFTRSFGTQHALVVAPRLLACLEGEGRTPTLGWGTTHLHLPELFRSRQWSSALDGRSLAKQWVEKAGLDDIFQTLPLALLLSS